MGIQVEFNPDLALRAHGTKGRLEEECIPNKLEVGKEYHFLKQGQRNYWLEGEIPLVVTEGNQNLSKPIASIKILEATHRLIDGKPSTWGTYKVKEIYDLMEDAIHFEGKDKI